MAPAPDDRRLTGSLIETYISDRLRRHEISVLTARNVRSSLYSFARSFGERPLRQLGEADVERWLGSMQKQAASSRRHQLSFLRQFCRWLVRRRYIRRDPTVDVAKIKVPRSIPRALPATAVERLLAAAPDARAKVMCLLEVQEGLRCCEVANLELGDIDFLGRTMRVTGKGGHQRVLPISDETFEAIQGYLAEHPAGAGPLIRSYVREWAGLKAATISGMVSEWMSLAGIKRRPRDGVSAHALRHTMATDALRNGAHLRDIQSALGHAHLRATEVYLPLVVHDLREAMGGRRYRGGGG